MAIFLPGTAEELELSLEDLTPGKSWRSWTSMS